MHLMHPNGIGAISSPSQPLTVSGLHEGAICRKNHNAMRLRAHSRHISQGLATSSTDRTQLQGSKLRDRNIRCSAERKTEREPDRKRMPPPPPPPPPSPQRLMQPLPPPPPPPPPRESRDVSLKSAQLAAGTVTQVYRSSNAWGVLGPFGRRGSLLAIMFGGAALLSLSIAARDPVPQLYQYSDSNAIFTQTAGGAELAVFADELGNFYWVDAHFNFWYDTGDPRLGVYVVDPNGVTLNIYIDGDGEPQYIPIGNLDDMRQVEVNEIGGIPVEAIQNASAKTKRLYVFPGKEGVTLPDSAPAEIGPDGTIRPPRMLEEGGIIVQEKAKSPWPFGERVPDDDPFKRR